MLYSFQEVVAVAIKKNNLVEKRNVLNEVRQNNMTLQEIRFFSIYLSKINARDISTRKVIFPLEDFRKIMELGRLKINYLQSVTNSLLSKVVNVKNEDGGYTAFQLFKRCKVFKDDTEQWCIEIDAHDDALPLMFEFKKEYFTYELWNALRLKSSNQLRMYEILKQYEKVGSRKVSVKELRELLGITPTEYPRWSDFKRRVLDSCQQALEESTDIKFTYKLIRSGRGGKITGLEFFISKNKNYTDQLTLEEFIDLQPDALEVEVQEQEPEKQFKNEELEFLAEACGNEFTEEEMQVLFSLVAVKKLPEHEYGVRVSQYHYLAEKYAELNVQASKRKIKSRFAYLKKMIQAAIK